MGITKQGPFRVPKLSENYPQYGRLLAREAEKLVALPDFSDDRRLFILSDFGGEHNGADYATYSILICSADKRAVFEKKVKLLRLKYGLNVPWKEMAFKDLHYGPISRSLDDFLYIADNFIHGVLVTISIDRRIQSLFDSNKKEAKDKIVELFRNNDLGEWKRHESEKVLRICHAISVFMSLVAYPNQNILWLCDHDSINIDGNKRDFTHTQKIFYHCLAMYSDNRYEIYGFAKPFKRDAGTTDLLSLSDFSAGIIQEILQCKLMKKDINLSNEKAKLAKWMGTESRFLTKVNLVFQEQEDKDFGAGTVDIREIL